MLRRPGPSPPHGHEIEPEIGIGDRLRVSGAGHWFRDQDGSTRRRGAVHPLQEEAHGFVVVVEEDPDERDDVETQWQLVAMEVATKGGRPVRDALAREACLGLGRDGWQVEHGHAELRVALRNGGCEGAVAAADVEQLVAGLEWIGCHDILCDERLGGGHKG